MATFAQVDAFISKYNGKAVDRDGAYGAQCVDMSAQYTAELFGVGYLPTPVTGGARDVYERFSLGGQFDRIANTPSFVPRKGDVVVWGAMPGNNFGHIAIANGVGNTSTFQSFDQNWGGKMYGQIVTHNYNYVLGVLRPKNLIEQEAPVAETKEQAEQRLLRAVDEWINKHAAVTAQRDNLEHQVGSLTTQIQSQQAEITKLNDQIKNMQDRPTPTETVEVPVGLDQMSIGQLLQAIFTKLLKYK